MPDNANPTIHSTASAASSRRTRVAGLDLDDDDEWQRWGDDLVRAGSEGDDEWDAASLAAAAGHLDEQIDQDEIFDLIRSISDPEHPLTLEQLAVVSAPQITVQHGKRPSVLVEFTPTIPHCSMATLIGLSLRVRLLRSLPERFKVDIKVKEGTHQSENAVNKQLNDKERVAAALENSHLLSVVQQCLSTADQRGKTP
ncbi:iron-sulfur cluster assembly protein CIA2 [Rhodotorula paludigena]|uniref:iron-sulfur cluster assembly protein CIA2 n=1 Tax=Rhodotorula paludigena TaxID=86838 RepID=UPI00317C240C